jgi:hypothetical protein
MQSVQVFQLLMQALTVYRSSTRMVAFVLPASIATDPFFQQLLSYLARSVLRVHLTASINETIGTPSSNKTNPVLLSSFTPDIISRAAGAEFMIKI